MMSYGDTRLYYLDPKEKVEKERDWTNVIWVLLDSKVREKEL